MHTYQSINFHFEGTVAEWSKWDSGFNQEYEQMYYMTRYGPGFVEPERHI
jgi:hypothetical protein